MNVIIYLMTAVNPISPVPPLPSTPPAPLVESPNILTGTNKKPGPITKFLQLLVVSLTLAFIGFASFTIYQSLREKQTNLSPALSPSLNPISSPSFNPTATISAIPADWKTYTNNDLNFEIKYPPELRIEKEFNDQYNRGAQFIGSNINLWISLRKDENNTPLEKYFYLDQEASGQIVLGGQKALIFKSETGYCDGPSCGKPYIAYVLKKDNDFYVISFSGATTLSNIENQILSTFRFLN